MDGFLGAARMDPELGGITRRNIAAALLTPLRWTTVNSAAVCFVAMVSNSSQSPAVELLQYRILTALGVIALVALLAWVAREIRVVPRRARLSVLKAKPLLIVRLVIALCALIVAPLLLVGPESTALMRIAAGLLITALVVATIGWKEGS